MAACIQIGIGNRNVDFIYILKCIQYQDHPITYVIIHYIVVMAVVVWKFYDSVGVELNVLYLYQIFALTDISNFPVTLLNFV